MPQPVSKSEASASPPERKKELCFRDMMLEKMLTFWFKICLGLWPQILPFSLLFSAFPSLLVFFQSLSCNKPASASGPLHKLFPLLGKVLLLLPFAWMTPANFSDFKSRSLPWLLRLESVSLFYIETSDIGHTLLDVLVLYLFLFDVYLLHCPLEAQWRQGSDFYYVQKIKDVREMKKSIHNAIFSSVSIYWVTSVY